MKKKTVLIVVIVAMMLVLAGCCLSHDWKPASCVAPVTCSKCGETEGEALAHIWKDATCTDPKTCNRCAETMGEALGHKWKDATCTDAQTCTVCAEVNGSPLDHKKGEWVVTKEPNAGAAGVQVCYCTVCNEVVEQKDYFHPYFKMSFDEFMETHNSTYLSQGWSIRKVDTGFSYFMNGKDTAIIFHDNLNTKDSNVITAYSTASLEKFNEIKFRIIDHGSSYINTDNVATVLMLGGVVFQPLVGYDTSTFLDDFTENMSMTRTGEKYQEWEATLGGYQYFVRAVVMDDSYTRVFYEFECIAI